MPAIGLWLTLILLAGTGEGHLFHKVYVVPDNQLTRDYVLLLRLIDFPHERFEIAQVGVR